ncbi:capsid protein [Apis mellifera virus-5]|nr:capsid protein [Apis mellifera virus-5]
MKYFRKRFSRRRSTSTFRRSRYIRKFPRPGSKRFYRRQRKNAKPEIKFFYRTHAVNNGNVVAHDGNSTDILTPSTIPAGADIAQRIGRSVKYRKVIYRFQIFTYDDPNANDDNVDGKIRVLLWYPTRDYTSASTYVNTLPFLEEPDWNTIRVVRDTYHQLSYARYLFTAGNLNFNPAPPTPTSIVKKYVVNFPRTVEFVDPAGTTDPNKDRLYCTVYNSTNFALNWTYSAKTTYIDP